jgi:hypothetical protein
MRTRIKPPESRPTVRAERKIQAYIEVATNNGRERITDSQVSGALALLNERLSRYVTGHLTVPFDYKKAGLEPAIRPLIKLHDQGPQAFESPGRHASLGALLKELGAPVKTGSNPGGLRPNELSPKKIQAAIDLFFADGRVDRHEASALLQLAGSHWDRDSGRPGSQEIQQVIHRNPDRHGNKIIELGLGL